MNNPDFLAAIRDLHQAIVALTDELRRRRLAEQVDIEALIELHQQKPLKPAGEEGNS